MLERQGKYSEALEIYRKVFDVQQGRDALGPDHPDTSRTCYNMARVFSEQDEYSKTMKTYREVFKKRRDVLVHDHPDALLTSCKIKIVRKKINTESRRESQRQESECSIRFYQEQQKAYLHSSQFILRNPQNASIVSVKQGLYLHSFKTRNVKVMVSVCCHSWPISGSTTAGQRIIRLVSKFIREFKIMNSSNQIES